MPDDSPVIGTSEQLLILEVAGMMALTCAGVVVRVLTVVLLSTGGFGCTRRIPGSVLSASSGANCDVAQGYIYVPVVLVSLLLSDSC